MTLDKAILTNSTLLRVLAVSLKEDEKCAIQLGIEALKAWKERRENYPMLNTYYLPGETKE